MANCTIRSMLTPESPPGGPTLDSLLYCKGMRNIINICLSPSQVIAVGCNPIRTGSLSAVVGFSIKTRKAYYTAVIVTRIYLLRHW